MPQRINMVISNNNISTQIQQIQRQMMIQQSRTLPTASNALNAPIIARIHNVKAGCGSCGRH
jgi:hypothetical protein